MDHSTLVDEQQGLLADYQRSVTIYIQIQKEAETQLKQERAAADDMLIKSNKQADTLWSKIQTTHKEAQTLLEVGGWQSVLTGVKTLPPGSVESLASGAVRRDGWKGGWNVRRASLSRKYFEPCLNRR